MLTVTAKGARYTLESVAGVRTVTIHGAAGFSLADSGEITGEAFKRRRRRRAEVVKTMQAQLPGFDGAVAHWIIG